MDVSVSICLSVKKEGDTHTFFPVSGASITYGFVSEGYSLDIF